MFRFATLCFTTTALSAVSAMAAPMPAKTYVMKAGASDMYEMQSSQLVMKSSTDPKIKQFAQQMIADHTQSTADVKAAAMQAHMHPAPPHLDAMGASNLAKLRAAHGMARDQMYVMQQKMAHKDALALHQGYAADGTVDPLKMAAAKIAPVVQSHIDMLNGMGGAMSGM